VSADHGVFVPVLRQPAHLRKGGGGIARADAAIGQAQRQPVLRRRMAKCCGAPVETLRFDRIGRQRAAA